MTNGGEEHAIMPSFNPCYLIWWDNTMTMPFLHHCTQHRLRQGQSSGNLEQEIWKHRTHGETDPEGRWSLRDQGTWVSTILMYKGQWSLIVLYCHLPIAALFGYTLPLSGSHCHSPLINCTHPCVYATLIITMSGMLSQDYNLNPILDSNGSYMMQLHPIFRGYDVAVTCAKAAVLRMQENKGHVCLPHDYHWRPLLALTPISNLHELFGTSLRVPTTSGHHCHLSLTSLIEVVDIFTCKCTALFPTYNGLDYLFYVTQICQLKVQLFDYH
jgi:hypothetical protein